MKQTVNDLYLLITNNGKLVKNKGGSSAQV